MEGSRLLLKRRSKRRAEQMLLVLGAGVVVTMAATFMQMKATLSSHNLAAVREDFQKLQGSVNLEDSSVAPQEEEKTSEEAAKEEVIADLNEFRVLLEASLKAQEGQVAGETTTNYLPLSEPLAPSTP